MVKIEEVEIGGHTAPMGRSGNVCSDNYKRDRRREKDNIKMDLRNIMRWNVEPDDSRAQD
jgi:hypothetical protein